MSLHEKSAIKGALATLPVARWEYSRGRWSGNFPSLSQACENAPIRVPQESEKETL